MMKHTAASTMKDARQPTAAIRLLTAGEKIAPPKPEPLSATATASPCLSVNQFVSTIEMSKRVPATMTKPSMAKSRKSCQAAPT